MRKSIWNFLDIVIQELPIEEPIYEFGAYQIEESPQEINLRPLFAGKNFIGCDMRDGPGVDKVLDLHNIDLPDNSAGTVFLMDTLEHVEYPHRALNEVHRVLSDNGIVIMSSVLDFVIHSTPNDFWRYTPDGFRSLLKPFASQFVSWYGPDYFPQSLVALGFKGDQPDLTKFSVRCENWKKNQTAKARKIELQLMQEELRKAEENNEI